ncbi:NAD(P)H-dependent oxidoreductase [Novosphingobium profundi]|uniref:NAD(P)H-dependent oxidoreductase n=1 Tax=Novosphingobium profundi TaxID=1774954 RepID=UPI001BD9E003|nr:NAD(P)H-dependent oxidoreductase [Novosphingobium profundi]MBT0668945.1 NAD(P)H-dependent oxidoreductase [Novosphingobium profundi]
MASILSILASPYGAASRGATLAAQAAANLQAADPSLALVERDLSTLARSVIPSSYADAVLARQPSEHAAFDLSETLIREVEDAAFITIATPMHNYTVPASLKLWIDLVLRHSRSFAPVNGVKTGLLGDRPVLVVVTSGGAVTGKEAGQPDHLTGYLTDVLSTIGISDVRFIYLEGLVNPVQAGIAMAAGARAMLQDPVFAGRQGGESAMAHAVNG